MKKYILLFVLYIAGFHVLFAQFWGPTNPSGTDEDLYDVYFTGIDKGYVVGGNGLILYTVSGGITWTEQNSGVSGYLHGIVFTDNATGYAVGNNGLVLKHMFEEGIMDESADSPVHLYPNPATGQLHLDLSRIEGPVHLDVYTVQGVKIFSGSHLKKNYALDVSSWAPGIYIAEIQYANHTGKYKFCVQ